MRKVLDEGNLRFDFSVFDSAQRFDDALTNPYGMKAVDFLAEDADCVYFIEVKDFQNPKASADRRREDLRMLQAVGSKDDIVFAIEMGVKIKDSLLRTYATGDAFTKNLCYLLLIHLDNLSAHERGLLKARINGHIPVGLNHVRFPLFTSITFHLVNIEELKQFGIICTQISE